MRPRRIWPWWALAVLIAAWLLWMTLRPNPGVAQDLSALTEPAAERGVSAHLLIDLAGNVVVFVPLGAALALALAGLPRWRPPALATLGGAGLSLAIELLQTAIPSRVSGVDDWLLNTTGAAIGAGIAHGIGTVLAHAPRGRESRLPIEGGLEG